MLHLIEPRPAGVWLRLSAYVVEGSAEGGEVGITFYQDERQNARGTAIWKLKSPSLVGKAGKHIRLEHLCRLSQTAVGMLLHLELPDGCKLTNLEYTFAMATQADIERILGQPKELEKVDG